MNGLSSKEVLKSRELNGSNKLPEPKLDKWYDFAKEALSERVYKNRCEKPTSLGVGWIACIC